MRPGDAIERFLEWQKWQPQTYRTIILVIVAVALFPIVLPFAIREVV